MSWNNLRMIHEAYDEPEYGRDGFGERAGDASSAYQEGYRRGFADAMRESSGYGERREFYHEYPERLERMRERNESYFGMRGGYQDEMGERRRRRSNGQYM